jgi:SAM-dependent methyltransferase
MLGVDHHRWLFSLMQENASLILEEKARRLDEPTRQLVSSEDDRTHFGDIDLEDRGLQTVVRSFTIDRILFIRECLQGRSPGPVADLGDTNGIFLRSLGEDGISVNISEKAVTILHGRGLDAIRADIEHLPFRDSSLAVLLLFETLEHVPNPIRALHESARVTSGSLILSVPHVTRTAIHPRLYDPTKPVHQHHIFEFSPDDLRRITTHTPFTIERTRIATVIEGRTLLGRIVIPLWRFLEQDMFCGCFTRFYLCHLVKRS